MTLIKLLIHLFIIISVIGILTGVYKFVWQERMIKSAMKKTYFILFSVLVLSLCFIALLYGVGLYFLEDRFTTPDAAPLADPHTTEPGGQSVDAIETDGTMAIANGKLTFTAQSSPVDGDLGLRYATDMSDFMGRAIFYKLQFSSLAIGLDAYFINDGGRRRWIVQ